jgi:hypothetical protein
MAVAEEALAVVVAVAEEALVAVVAVTAKPEERLAGRPEEPGESTAEARKSAPSYRAALCNEWSHADQSRV